MPRLKDTARRGLSALVAADAVGDIIRSPLASTASIARSTWRVARLLATPERATGEFDGEPDPCRRFDLAREKYRVPSSRLPALERQLWRQWAMWFLAAILTASFGLIIAPEAGRALPFGFGYLALLSMPIVCFAMTAKMAFYHWQVRTRQLGGFKEWLRQPGEWWPLCDTSQYRSLTTLLVLGLGAMTLVPTAAWAATDPAAASDFASQIINAILPGGLTGPGNPATKALGVMSATLYALGAGMLTYHTLVGLVASAHEGVVLGRRVHTTWAPIQAAIGFGMLFPLPSGLSPIHGIVFMVAEKGSAMATDIWSEFVDDVLAPKLGDGAMPSAMPALSLSANGFGLKFAHEVLSAETCQRIFALNAAAGLSKSQPSPDVAGVDDGNGHRLWSYGDRCGGISIPLIQPTPTNDNAAAVAFSAARAKAIGDLISAIRNGGLPDQIVGASVPSGLAEGYGGNVIPGYQPDAGFPASIAGALKPAATAYETALQNAASQFLAARDKEVRQRLIDHSKTDGWMAAGAYWRTLSQVGDQLVQLASESPAVTAPNVAPNWLGRLPGDIQKDVVQMFGHTDSAWATETQSDRLTGQDLASFGDKANESDLMTRITAPLTKNVANAVESTLRYDSANPQDPESSLMNLGHRMMWAGEAAIVAGVGAAAFAGNGLSSLAGGSLMFEWVSHFATWLIGACMAIGWVLAFLLPMLVYCAVLWLAVGWILGIVEATIAAPIYAWSFMRLDAEDGLVGSVQKPGATLLFYLFFKPSIGILGLLFLFYTLPVATGMLDAWFAPAYVGQQGGHTVGPAALLAGLGFFTYLQYQLHVRCLALVHTLPDKLPRWLGFSAEGFGEADAHRETSHTIIASSHSVSGRIAPESPRPKGGNGGNDKGAARDGIKPVNLGHPAAGLKPQEE